MVEYWKPYWEKHGQPEIASSPKRNPIPDEVRSLAKTIIAETAERREGIRLDRIQSFFEEKKLETTASLVIMDSDSLPMLQKRMREMIGYELKLNHDSMPGQFMPEIDLILVARNRERERLNGPIYTEGMIVHEMAHSSSRFPLYARTESRADHKPATHYRHPRIGFMLQVSQTGAFRSFAFYARRIYSFRSGRKRYETARDSKESL